MISGLKIGNGRDGQGDALASDVDIDFGAGEIEARLRLRSGEDEREQKEERQTPQQNHSPSLDGVAGGADGRSGGHRYTEVLCLPAEFTAGWSLALGRLIAGDHVPRRMLYVGARWR